MIRKVKRNLGFILAIGLIMFGLASEFYGQTSETPETLRRINIKFEDFRYNLNANLNRESFTREQENEINNSMNALEDSILDFEAKLNKKTEKSDDVVAMNRAAEDVSRFVSKSRLDAKVQNSWRDFNDLVVKLASNYSNFADTSPRETSNRQSNSGNSSGNSLSGTYRINLSRSDVAREIVSNATRNSPQSEKDVAFRHLEEKLESPEMIAIENQGKSFTIASSKSPRANFEANGQENIQRNSEGKNVRVRSELGDDELTISVEQEAQTRNRLRDFSYVVTFSVMDNGDSLRIIRRLTDDEINQTFIVTTYYERTSEFADLDIYDTGINPQTNRDPKSPTITKGRRGEYAVADGTILTGILQDNISTKVSQNGDRFRMKIESPNQYRGAIIEGYVSGINRSGKVSGTSKLTFNFEKILLSSGETYDFAGFLQSITDKVGKTVKIDEEGTASGKSQTKEAIKRGGIGAGAGAVIGAIIGGAKGAIIGATIGGGAGAGSVIVTGKQDVELVEGSTITVQSSAPIK